jgi:hypothetical protein
MQVLLLSDEDITRCGLVASGLEDGGKLLVGLGPVRMGVMGDQVQPFVPADGMK